MTINDDKNFYKQKLWLGVSRWTWVRLAFVFMLVMSSVGLLAVERNGDNDAARFRQTAIEQCDRGNNVRQVIRDIVTTSYGSGLTIDLATLPNYSKLDTETKAFVDDLNGLLSSSSTPEVRQQRIDAALKLVPLIDCSTVNG